MKTHPPRQSTRSPVVPARRARDRASSRSHLRERARVVIPLSRASAPVRRIERGARARGDGKKFIRAIARARGRHRPHRARACADDDDDVRIAKDPLERHSRAPRRRAMGGDRAYARDGVADDCREDGRGRATRRALRMAIGVVPNANGSCAVTLGETSCVAAVRCDVTAIEAWEASDAGAIVLRVDASSIATTRAGRAAAVGETLRRRLESVVAGRERGVSDASGRASGSGVDAWDGGGIDLRSLCVRPGRARWTLAVDAVCACDRGSMLDALSVAVRGALADTKIPKVSLVGVGSDGEGGELEIDDDPDACTRVDVSRCGVVATTTKIGKHGVVDATDEEEACAEASMSVGVDRDGMVCGEFTTGGETLDRGTADAMRKLSCRVGVELIEAMDAFLATAVAANKIDEDEDGRVMVVRVRK